MKRREFLSLTARTAALTAIPALNTQAAAPVPHGGITPRRVNHAGDYVASAASFSEAHPDKLADLIGETLIDSYVEYYDQKIISEGVEVFVSGNQILIDGRLVCGRRPPDRKQRIRDLLRDVGHTGEEFTIDPDKIEIRLQYIEGYPDIAMGYPDVIYPDESALIYGYATDETLELMPLPTQLAHQLSRRIDVVRRSGVLPWLLPYARTSVTCRYRDGRPVVADAIEVTVQHRPVVSEYQLREAIIEEVVLPVLPSDMLPDWPNIDINPTGNCVVDGLIIKSGISGRLLASDTYGAHCPLQIAGLSGSAPFNIRRLGSYMARYLAKQVVAAELAHRCTVHLAYTAGRHEPYVLLVDTHGTGMVPEEQIEAAMLSSFDLTLGGIVHHLDLFKPLCRLVAAFGYFGHEEPEFTWERYDGVETMKAAIRG